MKIGDKIILKDGRSGIYKGHADKNFGTVQVELYGEIRIMPVVDVSPYFPITDDETEAWCLKHAPEVAKAVEQVYATLFPGRKYLLSVDGGHIDLNGITLSPIAVQVRGILGVKEFPGFELSEWKVYPATRWEPEDAEPVVISEHRNVMDAARALVQHAISQEIAQWFEGRAMDEYVKELREEYQYDG